jgi:hypothetical protein
MRVKAQLFAALYLLLLSITTALVLREMLDVALR